LVFISPNHQFSVLFTPSGAWSNELGDFKGVGHFEAKFWIQGLKGYVS